MRFIQFILGSCLLLGCSSKPAPSTQASKKPVVVTDTVIEILDKIYFDEGATLSKSSTPMLEAIAATLDGNPDIRQVAIQAYSADQELSERRGQTIIDFLLAKGITPERLTNQPMVSEDEKVEFEILRRGSEEEETEEEDERAAEPRELHPGQ